MWFLVIACYINVAKKQPDQRKSKDHPLKWQITKIKMQNGLLKAWAGERYNFDRYHHFHGHSDLCA